jgi:arylsulfatase A
LAAAVGLARAEASLKDGRLPNLVIIFMDDMGNADVGCFGAQGYKTPNIDRLAIEGRKFTNFHVAQPVCSASRAALMTGCYPSRVGIHGALGPKATHGISGMEMTLAEVVKQKGYATAAIGKWHLGHLTPFLPKHHGFDEYYGLPYSNDMWPHHPERSEKEREVYPKLPLIEGDEVVDSEVTAEDQTRLTTDYTTRAVAFIERNKGNLFFLYLAHSMVHVPLFVSEKFKGKSGQGLFADVMLEVDWSVGQVLDSLSRNHLDKDTLVVFTSDNGPWLSYGEHAGSATPLREGKGTCWEGGTRVPCLMRWPGHIPAGTSSESMLMTIDILPTVASLIGATLPDHKIDGLDVWPILSGHSAAPNPHDFYAFYYEKNELQAVTTGDGRWKLQLPHTYRTLAGQPGGTDGTPVKYKQAKLEQPELYDLATDIGETKNLAENNPGLVTRLNGYAEQARLDLGDSITKRTGSGARSAGETAKQ